MVIRCPSCGNIFSKIYSWQERCMKCDYEKPIDKEEVHAVSHLANTIRYRSVT